jgi:hypothetical protein
MFTISAIILIGTVAAAPVVPDEFYGTVYLNGNPAPAGTVIIAKINSEIRGTITTTDTGIYGGSGNFDPRLYVNLTEEEMKAGNPTIIFFVGGVQAFQTVKSGNSGKLDLIANERAYAMDNATTTSSSGGSAISSGGSGGFSTTGAGSSTTGTISSSTTGNVGQSTDSSTTPNTVSRSSVYYNIDATQTSPAMTIPATTPATPSPVVTAVPTTRKAGTGPLSVVVLVTSIICILGILQWNGHIKKKN